ncbi:biotin/lipoate A/B protein ligase family protein [Salinirubellus sp. GCM10025818]|uniref:lipoate--protein ligase family protein n=1 Tax=Salinirubellus TaxID=2162630 RepID=UPI0030CDA0AC
MERDVADREWRLVREEDLDGARAMAYDEVAAGTAAAGGPRTVRVYRWAPSTLSLGYRQPAADVDWEWCEREGVGVVRRPTGGGAIYHDSFGDISYSIVAPAAELPGDLMETYERLCEPVLEAFRRMGVDADFADEPKESILYPACYLRDVNPAHDVLAGGRKVSGNAQYRTRDAVIQHGSLSFSTDPERHLSCFADHGIPPERFTERVAGIDEFADVTREECVAILESTLAEWAGAEPGTWTGDERDRVAEIADGKYRTGAWTRDRTDPLAE